jgi:hypothetical protein
MSTFRSLLLLGMCLLGAASERRLTHPPGLWLAEMRASLIAALLLVAGVATVLARTLPPHMRDKEHHHHRAQPKPKPQPMPPLTGDAPVCDPNRRTDCGCVILVPVFASTISLGAALCCALF